MFIRFVHLLSNHHEVLVTHQTIYGQKKIKIWSKYGQNMVNMFHKHYQKLIVSWGNSSSTKHASSEIRIVTSSRRANTPWWFRKVRETELVCVPFLDKAMVNHVMWSIITTTSWKLSLSSCQSLNWQTWTWLGNDRSVIWTWGHNPSPNPINLCGINLPFPVMGGKNWYCFYPHGSWFMGFHWIS